MDDREAIDAYDTLGATGANGHEPVRWPDVELTHDRLRTLFEGVLGTQLDLVRIAFGDAGGLADEEGRVEEAWRTDALQARFAPEGVFVRARCSVRLRLTDDTEAGETTSVTVVLSGELCVSFVEQHHTCPFVDFMGGSLSVRHDDGTQGSERRLDPFSLRTEPAQLVEWFIS